MLADRITNRAVERFTGWGSIVALLLLAIAGCTGNPLKKSESADLRERRNPADVDEARLVNAEKDTAD